jgi:hypothetical protein
MPIYPSKAQHRSPAATLEPIVQHHTERNRAIIDACATGAAFLPTDRSVY